MANEKLGDKVSGEVTALPNQQVMAMAADDRWFTTKLAERGGAWAKKNPAKTSLAAAAAGTMIAHRVINPGYDWAKKGILGLFSKKMEEKVTSEAKNAMSSAGDLLGLVASSLGKLK